MHLKFRENKESAQGNPESGRVGASIKICLTVVSAYCCFPIIASSKYFEESVSVEQGKCYPFPS